MITTLLDLIDKLQENRENLLDTVVAGTDDFIEQIYTENAAVINDLQTNFNNFKNSVTDIIKSLVNDGAYYETEITNPTLTPGLWERPLRIMPTAGVANRFIGAKIIITPAPVAAPTTEVAYFALNNGIWMPSNPTSSNAITCKVPIPSASWLTNNGNLPPNITVNTWQLLNGTQRPLRYTVNLPCGNVMIGTEGIGLLSFINNTNPASTISSIKFCYIAPTRFSAS